MFSKTGNNAVVENNGAVMARFIIRKNASNQFWFVMQANNNKTILLSEMYTTKQAAKNGIQAIKQEAASAQIVDETGQDSQKVTTLGQYKEA